MSRNLIHPGLILLSMIEDDLAAPSAFFSWSPCECCGTTLAGDRYLCRALRRGKEDRSVLMRGIFQICPDCLERWQ